MNDINVVTATPQHIDLSQSPDQTKTIRTRKEDSEQRKQDFYKQLQQARQVEMGATKEETPHVEHNEPEQERNFEPVESHETTTEREFEAASDDYDDLENTKIIPKKRFDKEIEKRKLLEEEVRREREARIKFETELQLYNKALENLQSQQQQQQVEPELDPIDSDAHNLYMKKIRELEAKLERQNSNLSDYEIRQNFASTVNYQAAEMAKKAPDFEDAYNHLLKVEADKARMLGYDELQAQNYALQQIQPIAWQAYNQGKNVAEVTYNLAKAYGYKPKSSGTKQSDLPDLDKLEKNMQKSHSIINEVKGVSAKLTPDYAALTTQEGFEAKLAGKGGRGTDVQKFHEALKNLRKATSGNYGN